MTYEENNGNTVHESASDLQNDARTCEPRDAPLTQPCSLDVLARHLARIRPTVEPGKRSLVSDLIGMIGKFESNPAVLRKNILDRIDAINAEER